MQRTRTVRTALQGAGVGFVVVFVSELVIHLVAASHPFSELRHLSYAFVLPYKWIALEFDLVRPPNIVAGLILGVIALCVNSVIAGALGAIAALSIRKCWSRSGDFS